MAADAVPGFDPEDLFGLRRALQALPDELRDVFLDRWVELGERADCDIESIQLGAVKAARGCALVDGGDRLCVAWSTVARAMGAYLDWRAAYSRTVGL